MAGKRKKKGGDGEHENSERWLLTYADMITLLMAFFIMMYSMSVMNLRKFNEVAFSIRSGFGGMLTGRGLHLLNQPAGKHVNGPKDSGAEREALATVRKNLTTFLMLRKLQSKVSVQQDSRGTVISMMTDSLLFPRGSAAPTPRANEVLTEVGRLLRGMDNDIVIEGHTCNLPIATSTYPTNWELSAARACTVLRFLTRTGIPSWQMCAVGYGETRPMAPNDSEAHREKNRRVDVVILDTHTMPKSFRVSRQSIKPLTKPEIDKIHLVLPKVWTDEGENPAESAP